MIIDAVRDYLQTYSGLKTGAPVWVDALRENPEQYAVISLAGTKIVERYINGSSLREFPFAFQSIESTADDLARLEANGFFESFSDWLEEQTELGNLPVLESGKRAVSIEALGWGYLFEQGVSDTGIYQIQCRLVYEQDGR